MSGLRGALEERWYGSRDPGIVLRALAALYGAVVRMRRAAYRRGWLRVQRVGVPVVVVGNLVVGGTGKTPLVVALVDDLRARGWKPAVVSRGYGRTSRGQVVVEPETRASEGGDEPVLVARRCGVTVVVDADRVAAARRAVALGADIVVADDGLQHLRLHRDVEVEVLDAARMHGNGRLLPAGPLREPARETALRIVNMNEDSALATDAWSFRLVGDTLLSPDGRSLPLDALKGRRVHAIAGIGNPGRFFDRLRAHGLEPIEHAFADHHAYAPGDLRYEEALPIVMTEKDWVKCAGFAPPESWMLPVRAECGLDARGRSFLDEIARHLPRPGAVR